MNIPKMHVLSVEDGSYPEDIVEEMRKIWKDNEFDSQNEDTYYYWNTPVFGDAQLYPAIGKLLDSNDITECLIHYYSYDD